MHVHASDSKLTETGSVKFFVMSTGETTIESVGAWICLIRLRILEGCNSEVSACAGTFILGVLFYS